MKCTECIHYKECRKKKDLRRVNTKCNPSRFERVQKVMTNADHIRSMSDEELAKFLDGFTGCNYCSEYETAPFVGPGLCDCDGKCKRHLVVWLKQPYKEDEVG